MPSVEVAAAVVSVRSTAIHLHEISKLQSEQRAIKLQDMRLVEISQDKYSTAVQEGM